MVAEQREERFKDINEAYRVLSDPERRAQYDRAREARAGARRERVFVDEGPGVGFGGLGEDLGIDLDDLFGGLFGGCRAAGPVAGADQETELELTVEEAYSGGRRSVSVAGPRGCAATRSLSRPG